MRRFHLKGLGTGDQTAIYRDSSIGTPYDANWVQHSAAVTVDKITADRDINKGVSLGEVPRFIEAPRLSAA